MIILQRSAFENTLLHGNFKSCQIFFHTYKSGRNPKFVSGIMILPLL